MTGYFLIFQPQNSLPSIFPLQFIARTCIFTGIPFVTSKSLCRPRVYRVAQTAANVKWSMYFVSLHLQLLADLDPLLGGEGLGSIIISLVSKCLVKGMVGRGVENVPLNGGTNGTVNDELGQDTNGTRHAEEHGVVVGLGQTVVLEQDTRVGVNVGVGVLGLAVLGQDAGGDLVDLADQLEHRVLGHLLLRKLALSHVARVGLAEHSVAVTGHNAARVQGGPQVVGDVLVAQVVSDRLLHLSEPVEHLLVGQTVQGASQTLETGRDRQEGRAESTADQVGGVSRDVSTLVVRVDGQIETQELNEVGVVAEAQLVGKVERVVLVLLDGGDLASLEDVLVDASGNRGQLGDQVHRVLERVSPVVLLVHALSVGLGERRGVLQGSDGQGELGHGVEIRGAAVDELLDELGDLGAGRPFGGQVAHLLLGRDLTSQEKPEET